MEKQNKDQYLDVLQIFRGIAAIMVVIHHSIGSLTYYDHLDNPFLIFIGKLGKYGVDFFFVLSGFIISYSSYYKLKQPNAFKNYVVNRVLRIYVPYLPIGILMLLLYTYIPSFSSVERSISTVTSLTLFPDGNPALSVAWTLTFEITFYILFSMMFFSKKLWNCFVAFWIAGILVFNIYFLSDSNNTYNPVIRTVFSLYNLEFLLGYFLSLLILKKIILNKNITLVLILLLTVEFLYCFYFKISYYKFFNDTQVSIIVFLTLYYYVTYYNYEIKKTALFMLIGNATYSIYLIHNPLQMIVIRLLPKSNTWPYAVFVIFFVIVISCIIGYTYYKIFEVFLLNKTKSYLLKKQ
jgi:peptidoglycan/LPS O-acetylase OafA/YrhL